MIKKLKILTIISSVILISGCISRPAVCPSIPTALLTPAPFDQMIGDYSAIPVQCGGYVEDSLNCTFNRFQDSENMKAAREIEDKIRK